jgi:hypothetical protein
MIKRRISLDTEKYKDLDLTSSDYLLLVGYDAKDIFRYFNRSDFNGLNLNDCIKRQSEGGTYIDGWANVSPIESLPPYLFLNATTLNEKPLYISIALIAHEVAHLVNLLDPIALEENEELRVTLLEETIIEICTILNYPKIYYKLDIWKL